MSATQPVVPLRELDDLDGQESEILKAVAARRGAIANVFKALANSVGALERVAELGEFLRFDSILPPELRETTILAVARERRCLYEWTHHLRIARQLDSDGYPPPVDSAETDPAPTAVRIATALAHGELAAESDVTLIHERFDDRGLIELLVLIGYYSLLADVINNVHVPLEDGVLPEPLPPLQ